MTEDNHRKWDVILKVVAGIAAFYTFLHGIDRYNNEQRAATESQHLQEVQNRERAFLIELFREDLRSYTKIAQAASRVASTTGKPDFEKAVQNYEELYWGTITLEGNDAVSKKMDDLRNAIRSFRAGNIPTGDTNPADQLKKRAFAVSEAARVAVADRIVNLKNIEDEN